MICLWEERYQSGLGELALRLYAEAEFVQIAQTDQETTVLTSGHEVRIVRGTLPAAWAPEQRPAGLTVTSAAWGFYIRKRNAAAEQLTFTIGLEQADAAIEASPDTGQWLTALELANPTTQLHIGTQDEDQLGWEAAEGKWAPLRLVAALTGYTVEVTTIEATGLRTQLPPLQEKEQFYFHYILAESARRKSVQYPDEWDLSTWFCVDQSRQKMEEIWQPPRASAAG